MSSSWVGDMKQKPTMTQEEKRRYESHRKQIQRAKKRKLAEIETKKENKLHKYLHSCHVLRFGPNRKIHHARYMSIYRLSQRIVRHTLDNHLESILKMPLNNQANSNLFLPSALDFYFGKTLEKISNNIVLRSAYGVHAGNSTIAMDPHGLKIRNMTTDMESLSEVCHQITKFHFEQPGVDPYRKVKCFPYTGCMFKAYNQTQTTVVMTGKNKGKPSRKKKKVKTHTDQEFNKKRKDCEAHEFVIENNSQTEMTPVCIVTYGDTKTLTFEQWRINSDGVKELVGTIHPVHFDLGSYSIFILDPRDEYKQGPNRVWYQHRAECKDTRGVSWSIIFRCLKRSCAVKVVASTGELVNPPSLGPKKDVDMHHARAAMATDTKSVHNINKEIAHIRRHLLNREGKYTTKNNSAVFDQFENFNQSETSEE